MDSRRAWPSNGTLSWDIDRANLGRRQGPLRCGSNRYQAMQTGSSEQAVGLRSTGFDIYRFMRRALQGRGMVGGRGVLDKAWSRRLKCPPCSLRFKRRNGLWQPWWLQTGLSRRVSGEPALLLSLLPMSLHLLGPAASPGDCALPRAGRLVSFLMAGASGGAVDQAWCRVQP